MIDKSVSERATVSDEADQIDYYLAALRECCVKPREGVHPEKCGAYVCAHGAALASLARRMLAERDEAREKLVGFVQAGAEAVVERDELQQLFDLQHTRSVQADKLWRQAHPGNELVQPDLGKLLEWLMARIASLERELAEVRDLNHLGLWTAWQRYMELFREPPHGTQKQIAALLELVPKGK